MKVKSKRKMAGILAAVLIALLLLAFDCINGDPISERHAPGHTVCGKTLPGPDFYGRKRRFDAGILLYNQSAVPAKQGYLVLCGNALLAFYQ